MKHFALSLVSVNWFMWGLGFILHENMRGETCVCECVIGPVWFTFINESTFQ